MKLAYIVVCYHEGSKDPTPMSLAFGTKEEAKEYMDKMISDQNELDEILKSGKERGERFHQLIDDVDIFKATGNYDIIPISIREEE